MQDNRRQEVWTPFSVTLMCHVFLYPCLKGQQNLNISCEQALHLNKLSIWGILQDDILCEWPIKGALREIHNLGVISLGVKEVISAKGV